MTLIRPVSTKQLAQALGDAGAARQSIHLGGNFSKLGMGGAVAPSDLTISTCGLNRILQYDARDLTVSVEAGVPFAELSRVLAEHKQMIPLDPPGFDRTTIGGLVAANLSGPRRRLYGTARDMVIGLTFATLEGKLIQTGGMVVKNVAGLDMAKVLIGSFGTLAAIATVNFKVSPIPQSTRTFVQRFSGIREAMAARDSALKSVLQPTAIDLRKTPDAYELLIQAGGNLAVLNRFSREFKSAEMLEAEAEERFWQDIRETTPRFLERHPEGAVVRVSCKLTEIGAVLESLPAPALARAGSGIVYGYFEDAGSAAQVKNSLLEFAPERIRRSLSPEASGNDFAMMRRMKQMLDPEGLLNRGRLYGNI